MSLQFKLAQPSWLLCWCGIGAIDIVNSVLRFFEAPIDVRHEVVHNKFVSESLKARV